MKNLLKFFLLPIIGIGFLSQYTFAVVQDRDSCWKEYMDCKQDNSKTAYIFSYSRDTCEAICSSGSPVPWPDEPTKDGYSFKGRYTYGEPTLYNSGNIGFYQSIGKERFDFYARREKIPSSIYSLKDEDGNPVKTIIRGDEAMTIAALDLSNAEYRASNFYRGFNEAVFDKEWDENNSAVLKSEWIGDSNASGTGTYYGEDGKMYGNTNGSGNNNIWGGGNDNFENGYNPNPTNFEERQGPCPDGYHVPSKGEWNRLFIAWCSQEDNECRPRLENENKNGIKGDFGWDPSNHGYAEPFHFSLISVVLSNSIPSGWRGLLSTQFVSDFGIGAKGNTYRSSTPYANDDNSAWIFSANVFGNIGLTDHSRHVDGRYGPDIRCFKNEVVWPNSVNPGGENPEPPMTISHTVTFMYSGEVYDTQYVASGFTVTKPYRYLGDYYKEIKWYTDRGLTKLYNFNSPVIDNITLYGKLGRKNGIFYGLDENGNKAATIIWGDIEMTIAMMDLPGRYIWGLNDIITIPLKDVPLEIREAVTRDEHINAWGGGKDGFDNLFDPNPKNPATRQGPCNSGYHVPSIGERNKLIIARCGAAGDTQRYECNPRLNDELVGGVSGDLIKKFEDRSKYGEHYSTIYLENFEKKYSYIWNNSGSFTYIANEQVGKKLNSDFRNDFQLGDLEYWSSSPGTNINSEIGAEWYNHALGGVMNVNPGATVPRIDPYNNLVLPAVLSVRCFKNETIAPNGFFSDRTPYSYSARYYTAFFNDATKTLFAQYVTGYYLMNGKLYEGSPLYKPSDPTKDGYTFIGWYSDPELTEQYIFGSIPTSNITLYAKREKNSNGGGNTGGSTGGNEGGGTGGNEGGGTNNSTYTISFDSNGGTRVGNIPVKHGAYVANPSNSTKKGYTFLGRYTAKNGGTKVYFPYQATSDALYYAHREENTYSIRYNLNGGRGSISDEENIRYTESIRLPSTPTRDGYSFNGWNTKSNGKGTHYDGGEYVSKLAEGGNLTLYAQRKQDKNSDSGSSTSSSSSTSTNLSIQIANSKNPTIDDWIGVIIRTDKNYTGRITFPKVQFYSFDTQKWINVSLNNKSYVYDYDDYMNDGLRMASSDNGYKVIQKLIKFDQEGNYRIYVTDKNGAEKYLQLYVDPKAKTNIQIAPSSSQTTSQTTSQSTSQTTPTSNKITISTVYTGATQSTHGVDSSDEVYISRSCKSYRIQYNSQLGVYTSPDLDKNEYFVSKEYFKRYVDSKNPQKDGCPKNLGWVSAVYLGGSTSSDHYIAPNGKVYFISDQNGSYLSSQLNFPNKSFVSLSGLQYYIRDRNPLIKM